MDFLQEIVEKFPNWSILSWFADPLFVKRPQYGAGPKYTSWQFVWKNRPSFNLDFVEEIVQNFWKLSISRQFMSLQFFYKTNSPPP